MVALFYILNIAAIGVLIFFFYTRQVSKGGLKPFFIPALTYHLAAGILFGLLYKYYYGFGDTLNFFEEGLKYTQIARHDLKEFLGLLFSDDVVSDSMYGNQPRAHFMSKLTSVFVLLTGESYWLTTVYFTFFSFIGIWVFSEAVMETYETKTSAVLLLFFPSLTFWSVGISKESIAMLALGVLLMLLLRHYHGSRSVSLLTIVKALIMLLLLWKVKYYYAGVFMFVGTSLVLTYFLAYKADFVRSSVT
ncbi:MAG: hypothetical protein R3345_09915, partial [Fulvivirga sp.]|nr:hypothetical protein [Fulvivirga sp.]